MSKRWALPLVIGLSICVAIPGTTRSATIAGAQSPGSTSLAGARQGSRTYTPIKPRLAAGTSTCTWLYLPALPLADTNAHYWSLTLAADPGVSLTITGTYPAARYFSLQAYTTTATYLAGWSDSQIPPDPGSANPFATPSDPTAQRGHGTYTLHVAFEPQPSQPATDTIYLDAPQGTLIPLVYRIYLPDYGATMAGNVGLPTVTAYSTSTGLAVSCPQPFSHPTRLMPAPTRITTSSAHALTTGAPSFVRVTGLQLGGFGNVDSAYLAAVLPVTSTLYVIRFQVPTTPHTLFGGPIDPAAQLRYWSLCVGTAGAPTRQCVLDEATPTDRNGWATIVMGPWWARPWNAIPAYKVTWVSLDWFTKPYVVLIRHLLPAPTFTQSAFAVPFGFPPAMAMGSFAPTIMMCGAVQFATNFCASASTVERGVSR